MTSTARAQGSRVTITGPTIFEQVVSADRPASRDLRLLSLSLRQRGVSRQSQLRGSAEMRWSMRPLAYGFLSTPARSTAAHFRGPMKIRGPQNRRSALPTCRGRSPSNPRVPNSESRAPSHESRTPYPVSRVPYPAFDAYDSCAHSPPRLMRQPPLCFGAYWHRRFREGLRESQCNSAHWFS